MVPRQPPAQLTRRAPAQLPSASTRRRRSWLTAASALSAPALLLAALSASAGSCWLRPWAPSAWGATGFRRLALGLARACAPPSVARRQGDDGVEGLRLPAQPANLGAGEGKVLGGLQRFPVSDLQIGQGPITGIVSAVVKYGAFVDVGATRDGLVPISQVTGGFVKNIRDFVKPGEEVQVWVTDITGDGKLQLSMVENLQAGREMPREEWERSKGDVNSMKGIPSDQWLQGKVVTVKDYGLIVAAVPPAGGSPVQGLVYLSDIKDGFVEHPAQEASAGDEVKVRILGIQNGKMKLSMKAPAMSGAPDFTAFQNVPPTDWLDGRVHHTAPFGVFVDVKAPGGGRGARGFVHVTHIREGFVDDPSDEVSAGQSVKVRVLQVDMEKRRMSLAMLPPERMPE